MFKNNLFKEVRPRPYRDGVYYKFKIENARVGDVNDYLHANMWVRSPYDCSGGWITVKISCFQVGSDVIVYYFLGRDI